MRKIDLEELKQIELDMMKYLDKVCRDNHIKYFMVGGTLLGAVRHKGFIPWDDDIDIGMPREDFNKLKAILERENHFYKIAFFDTQKDYGYASPKMVDARTTLIDYKNGSGREESSVFIDIFLFDGMADTKIGAFARYYFLRIFKKAIFLSKRNFIMESVPKTILFAIPWALCKMIGSYRISKIYHALSGKNSIEKKNYAATASGVYGSKEVFFSEVFNSTVELPFEDCTLMAPGGYDCYLSSLYGDYMKLPPEEKRVSNHMSEEWWNE